MSALICAAEQIIQRNAVKIGELDCSPDRNIINAFFVAAIDFALHMKQIRDFLLRFVGVDA